MNSKIHTFTNICICLLGVGFILYIGKSIFISLIFSCFIYILLNSAYNFFYKKSHNKYISIGGCLLSMLTFFSVIYVIISTQIESFGNELPKYKEVISEFNNFLRDTAGISLDIGSFASQINFGAIFNSFSQVAAGFMGQLGTILFLLVFIFLERKFFMEKVKKVFSKNDEKKFLKITRKIHEDLSLYFGVKFIMALTNGTVSFVIMFLFGLEYALFFALLVFLLDFIPNIGGIIALSLPFLFSFTQFDSALISIVLLGALLVPQTITGNILEPKLIGSRLNLSGFIILLSLLFWGSLWGIVGAFLAVPLMTSINIILSKFKKTQKISIIMSEKGNI